MLDAYTAERVSTDKRRAMNVLASATHYGVWADADGVVRDDSKGM